MLPLDDGILREVANVRMPGLGAGIDEHPANVGPQEPVMRSIWILIGVGIPVVGQTVSHRQCGQKASRGIFAEWKISHL